MLAYLALALLQTAPAAEAPADASGQPPAAVAASAPTAAQSDTPSGAPADDYGFVAWCRGALTGHMELYKQVKPEMARLEAEKAAAQDRMLKTPEARAAAEAAREREAKADIELDAQQLAAGEQYVKLYGRALDAAESASPTPLHARGEAMVAQGYRIWAAARAADDRTRMWSYVMWELPARCETAAKALETNSSLFGQAFKASTPPAAEAAPAPMEAAQPTTEAPSPTSAPAPTPTIDSLIASEAAASPAPAADAPAEPPAAPPLRTPSSPKG